MNNYINFPWIIFLKIITLTYSCNLSKKPEKKNDKPNIILILADDMG